MLLETSNQYYTHVMLRFVMLGIMGYLNKGILGQGGGRHIRSCPFWNNPGVTKLLGNPGILSKRNIRTKTVASVYVICVCVVSRCGHWTWVLGGVLSTVISGQSV